MGKPKKQVVDVLSMLASEDGEQVPPAKIEEMLSGKSDALVDLFAKDLGYEGDSFSKQYGGAFEPDAPAAPKTKTDALFGKVKPLLTGSAPKTEDSPGGEFQAGGKQEAESNRTIEGLYNETVKAVKGRVSKILGQDPSFKPMLSPLGRIFNARKVEEATKRASEYELGRVVDLNSAERFVRDLASGGAPQDGTLNAAAGALNAVVSPVRRSAIGKIGPGLTNAGSLPSTIGRAKTKIMGGDLVGALHPVDRFNDARNAADAGLLPSLAGAAAEGELDAAKAKAQANIPLTEQEQEIIDRDSRGWGSKIGGAVGDMAKEAWRDPANFLQQQGDALGDPWNVGMMLLTGGAAGARNAAARSAGNVAARAKVIPKVKIPLSGLAGQAAEVGVIGAATQAANEGRVTTEGVVSGIPIAMGMSGVGRAFGKIRSRAEGGAAPRGEAPAAPVRPTAPTPEAPPIITPIPDVTIPPPDATAVPRAAGDGAPVPDALPAAFVPEQPRVGPIPEPGPGPTPKAKGRKGSRIKRTATGTDVSPARAAAQTQSVLETARREAQFFSDAGDPDLARSIIERTRPMHEALHGPEAQRAMDATLADIAATTERRKRGKAKEKQKQIAMDNPPMDKAEAQKAIEAARREAAYLAKNGELDAANQIIDDANDAYVARDGERAQNTIETEKRILAKQVPSKKAEPKPAKVKPKVPASTEEAVAIVQEAQDKIRQAVADVDIDAVRAAADEAAEAMKVVHPEGDAAVTKTQEIVREAEAQIEAAAPPQDAQAPVAAEPPATDAPAAPEPAAAPKPKNVKKVKKVKKAEDPIALAKKLRGGEPDGTESKERLTIQDGDRTIKFSSAADYAENPITASLNDFTQVQAALSGMRPGGPFTPVEQRMVSLYREREGGSDARMAAYSKKAFQDHETPDGPRSYADLAEEGSQYAFDGDAEGLNQFLQENNLTPQKFAEIMNATSMPMELQSEIGAIKEIIKNGRDGAARRGAATMAGAAGILGLVANALGVDDGGLTTAAALPLIAATPEASRAVATSVGNALTNIGNAAKVAAGKLETRANRLDRLGSGPVARSGKPRAKVAVAKLNHGMRRMVANANAVISKFGGEVRRAYEGLSSDETSSIGQLDIPGKGPNKNDAVFRVTDALEGKLDPNTLSPGEQRLFKAARDAFEYLRAWRERLTGAKGRDNYVTRKEDKHAIYKLMKSAEEQYGDGAFPDNEATTDIAAKIPDPVDPVVDAAMRSQADVMASGIEVMPDGTLSLTVDKNGRPILQNEAGYLWHLDDDNGNSLKPHLPEIFTTQRVKNADGSESTVPVLRKDKVWTKESLYELLKAEGLRLILKRTDVDPDAPRASTGMSKEFKSKRWQLDGSLTSERLMPYLGDQFYDRNIMNILAHTIERQARGLARIEMWGRDRSGILKQMQRIREAVPRSEVSDADLGVIMNKDGTVRLATNADGKAYANSIMRDLDDAAMGYARPFMDATNWQKVERLAAQMARFPLLLGRILPTVSDATYQLAAAGNIGLGTEFAKQRAGVMAHQAPGGLRALGSYALEGAAIPGKAVGAGKAMRDQAASLRYHDAMWEYMKAGLSDPSSILGATPGERMVAQAQRIVGAFSRNAEGGDIAARLSGIEWLKGWAAEQKRAGKIRSGDNANVLTESVHRSISRQEIRELMSLIDDNGELSSEAGARRFLEIAAPFADEVASQINGSSNVFLQPRFTSSIDAKNWAFMMMVPMSLMANAASNIARGARGGRTRMGKIASVAGRTGRLAATSAAGSLAKTGLMATNPALAATLLAIASGSTVPVGIAALTTGAWKDMDNIQVDNEKSKAAWTYLKNVPSASTADMIGAAARLTATGLPANPRFLNLNVMPQDVSDFAGFRAPSGASGAKFIGSLLEPGISAMADETIRRGRDLGLSYDLAKEGDLDNAIQLATASTFLPSTRELIGGKLKELRAGTQLLGGPGKKMDKADIMSTPYGPELEVQRRMRENMSKIRGVQEIMKR